MQFLVIAHDHKTADSKAMRANARSEHMQMLHALKAFGHIHDAGGILSEDGDMVGSMIIMDFPNLDALQKYLLNEPFKRNGVWNEIEIFPFRAVKWATSHPADNLA